MLSPSAVNAKRRQTEGAAFSQARTTASCSGRATRSLWHLNLGLRGGGVLVVFRMPGKQQEQGNICKTEKPVDTEMRVGSLNPADQRCSGSHFVATVFKETRSLHARGHSRELTASQPPANS